MVTKDIESADMERLLVRADDHKNNNNKSNNNGNKSNNNNNNNNNNHNNNSKEKSETNQSNGSVLRKDWCLRWTVSIICCIVVYFITRPGHLSEYEKQALARQHHDWYAHGIASNSSQSFGFWLKQGLPDEFSPKIVWFMVWQSGSWSDYFTNSIPHVTALSMASNYGEEVTNKGAYSIPIYPRHSEGPYWHGLGQEKVRHLPQNNVLTKTFCHQDCVDCGPSQYVVDSKKFAISCRNSTAKAPKGDQSTFIYPIKRVRKAVHLIRNPFHNLIQRFSWELQLAKKRKDQKFLDEYPMLPKKGFQKWCMMLDKKYLKETKSYFQEHPVKTTKSDHDSLALSELMEKSICHGEFYKYIQWHNHAFNVTAKLDTHVVYYEDFQKDFVGTWDKMLDFVELEKKEKPYGFPEPHDYSRFFNEEHRRDLGKLAKAISSETTWKHLKDFFSESANPKI